MRWSGGLAAIVLLSAACGRGPDRSAPLPPAAPAFPNQALDVKYVGSDACRSCHIEKWLSFSRTGMGRSFYPLAAARVIESWDRNNLVVNGRTGLRYRMSHRDGKFTMRQFVLDPSGAETAIDERELVYVVGSANHSRAYLVARGPRLYQAPVCWYTRDAVWDLCPGYEEKNDYFSREIDRTCVFCHNARMELLPGARNAFLEPYPHGIDCERCHGPGQLHVEKWASGEAPTGRGDPAIVNPKRLTPALRMQICFQCHLGDSKATERVPRQDRPLEAFRPGQPISGVLVPLRYQEGLPHDFGLSAQADRMLLSKCYTASGGRLECVTCHDPHVTVYRKDRPADFFDSKCLGCHAREACRGLAAARAATSPPDDCVACHMRKGEPDDHRHAAFTDHWIRGRTDDGGPRVRASIALVPYLPEEFDRLPEADRAFFMGRGYGLRSHSVPPDQQRPLWSRSEVKLKEAIARGTDRPDAWFFLGKALAAQGKHAEAAQAFAAAYTKDPSDHDIGFAHAQTLLRAKRIDDAERVLSEVSREHPASAAPWAELGRAEALRGRYAEALDAFAKAVVLEPSDAQLHESASMMLSALGRHDEAIREIEEAVRCAPERPGIWDSYARILARAGKTTAARYATERVSSLQAGE